MSYSNSEWRTIDPNEPVSLREDEKPPVSIAIDMMPASFGEAGDSSFMSQSAEERSKKFFEEQRAQCLAAQEAEAKIRNSDDPLDKIFAELMDEDDNISIDTIVETEKKKAEEQTSYEGVHGEQITKEDMKKKYEESVKKISDEYEAYRKSLLNIGDLSSMEPKKPRRRISLPDEHANWEYSDKDAEKQAEFELSMDSSKYRESTRSYSDGSKNYSSKNYRDVSYKVIDDEDDDKNNVFKFDFEYDKDAVVLSKRRFSRKHSVVGKELLTHFYVKEKQSEGSEKEDIFDWQRKAEIAREYEENSLKEKKEPFHIESKKIKKTVNKQQLAMIFFDLLGKASSIVQKSIKDCAGKEREKVEQKKSTSSNSSYYSSGYKGWGR